MILADYHCHTAFSSDSDASPESMIERAIALGFHTICITDHMDYLFPKQYKETFVFDLEDYFTMLNTCREKYGSSIKIRAGIELGLRNEDAVKDECLAYYRRITARCPFDFIIGSTHILEDTDPYYPEYWDKHTEREGLAAYFESILHNVNFYDTFHVYGHIDYLVRYLPSNQKDYAYADYRDLIDLILSRLIETGRGIEVNTAGYKYGLPYAHPRTEILTRYRELGGEILTIGSDGHKPEHLAYDFPRACEMLKSLGYRYYTLFENGKPDFVRL